MIRGVVVIPECVSTRTISLPYVTGVGAPIGVGKRWEGEKKRRINSHHMTHTCSVWWVVIASAGAGDVDVECGPRHVGSTQLSVINGHIFRAHSLRVDAIE